MWSDGGSWQGVKCTRFQKTRAESMRCEFRDRRAEQSPATVCPLPRTIVRYSGFQRAKALQCRNPDDGTMGTGGYFRQVKVDGEGWIIGSWGMAVYRRWRGTGDGTGCWRSVHHQLDAFYTFSRLAFKRSA